MSIGMNGIFRYDINNFKWLWVYFIVSIFRPINLWDAAQSPEKHHLYSLLSGTYLIDEYQTLPDIPFVATDGKTAIAGSKIR